MGEARMRGTYEERKDNPKGTRYRKLQRGPFRRRPTWTKNREGLAWMASQIRPYIPGIYS